MLEHKKIQNLSDYFVELNSRREKGVYFYRINGYSEEVGEFIKKYYDTARRTGVVIEGKIPNPDEGNLAYYNEIMGMDFQMSMDFIHVSLRKWLPRMNEFQRQNVAASIYDSLDSLRKAGKTENMLRNAYIKFMCWLYYKFERIVNQLGENHIPKILYEGQPEAALTGSIVMLSGRRETSQDCVMTTFYFRLGGKWGAMRRRASAARAKIARVTSTSSFSTAWRSSARSFSK